MYPPARHEPLNAPTASKSQLIRQFRVFLDQTNAPPSPNPFCGGILPAAMCSGWSVNSVYAHPGTDLKLAWQASAARSPSRRNSPCRGPSCANASVDTPTITNTALHRITASWEEPPLLFSALGGLRLFLGAPFRPFGGGNGAPRKRRRPPSAEKSREIGRAHV